ncbi:hypothetical protein Scep_020512 [Stephania cephalantha]|uniref:Uncharacterized protein n=1 Tax=Stephania cephalantha TaxID=152367 RepID=A0AAP0ICT9_9MAGN
MEKTGLKGELVIGVLCKEEKKSVSELTQNSHSIHDSAGGPYSGASTLALVARASFFTAGAVYGSLKLKYLKVSSTIDRSGFD